MRHHPHPLTTCRFDAVRRAAADTRRPRSRLSRIARRGPPPPNACASESAVRGTGRTRRRSARSRSTGRTGTTSRRRPLGTPLRLEASPPSRTPPPFVAPHRRRNAIARRRLGGGFRATSGGAVRSLLRPTRTYEAGFVGEYHELRSISRPELHHRPADVRFRGRRADEQLPRDLLVRQTLRDERHHLALALGELVQGRRDVG